MDTVQFEELKQLLETILLGQGKPQAARTSYVVRKKGQLFQVDELRVTEDVPEGVNPKEYAVTEVVDLLEKSKAIETTASGVNNTAVPYNQMPNTGPEKACSQCGKTMKIREGKNGQFWGCTGYRDGCKNTENV